MIHNRQHDPLNYRCGHNFKPEDCPYEHCETRKVCTKHSLSSSDIVHIMALSWVFGMFSVLLIEALGSHL